MFRNNNKEVICLAGFNIKDSKFWITKNPKPIDSYPIRVNIDTIHFHGYMGDYYKRLLQENVIPKWVKEYLNFQIII